MRTSLEDFNELINKYASQIDEDGVHIKTDNDSPQEAILRKISEREAQYTKLTENFVKINYNRYKFKEVHKWIFFWIMLLILIFIAVIFGIIAIKIVIIPPEQIIKHIPTLLGAYASFISAIIAIPLLIGKYLFNKTEEADLGKFVQDMQNYDREGQKLFKENFDKDYRNHY